MFLFGVLKRISYAKMKQIFFMTSNRNPVAIGLSQGGLISDVNGFFLICCFVAETAWRFGCAMFLYAVYFFSTKALFGWPQIGQT